MARTGRLIDTLKRELKARGMTYRTLAQALGLAESTVKQTFAGGNMTLARLDSVCEVLGIDIADLVRLSDDGTGSIARLSPELERELAEDPRLLLVAYLVINHWTFDAIIERYRLSDTDCIQLLAKLDRMGMAELLPGNRIRSRLATDFSWAPDGPIERYFRSQVQGRFLDGDFDEPDGFRTVRMGDVTPATLAQIATRLDSVGRLFDDLVREERRRPTAQKRGTLMILAVKHWQFEVFKSLERSSDESGTPQRPSPGRGVTR